MPIPADHYMCQKKDDLTKICSSFFAATGINYFQYYRIYNDSYVHGMLTNTDTLKRFIELDFPSFSSYKECDRGKHSYWFLWDEELPWLPVQIGRENGLYHGLTMVRRALNHFDMIGFAMPEERSNAASYYMNNIEKLKLFITSFEKDYSELLKESEKSKILLPDNNRDKNYQNLCLDSNNRFPISHTNGSSYLTFQEFSCIKLKAEGLTYKEIAKKLGLSHRSVETYFYRAKERTKCSIAKLEKLLLS